MTANRRLPIFVISFNRGPLLQKVIRSYNALLGPTEILVHDFGSDEPATLAILSELRRHGVRVFPDEKISSAEELNRVDKSVKAYFADGDVSPYVVTDCDIDMSIAAGNSLQVYEALLKRFPDAECVGPMLRIRDIPPNYPLFDQVMDRHIEQFWRHRPEWVDVAGARVAYLRGAIDTTFALHRAGEPFRRLKSGIRVYDPYEAQHLDWYADSKALRDSAYARSASARISHWGVKRAASRREDEGPRPAQYFYIERDERGELACKVAANPSAPQGGHALRRCSQFLRRAARRILRIPRRATPS